MCNQPTTDPPHTVNGKGTSAANVVPTSHVTNSEGFTQCLLLITEHPQHFLAYVPTDQLYDRLSAFLNPQSLVLILQSLQVDGTQQQSAKFWLLSVWERSLFECGGMATLC